MIPDQSASSKHILTVVLEDYFQVAAFRRHIPQRHWERFEITLERNTDSALQLLADTGNRATFFVSGWVADQHPDILTEVIKRGHEVACQGYFHHTVRDLSRQAFRDGLRRSRDAVETATGAPVRGFRISHGRIGPRDLWALDILVEEGFAFDSSLCPIGREFADEPFRSFVHRVRCPAGELWEVPVSTLRKFGWSLPISGGNYFRQFPDWPLRRAVDRWTKAHSAPLVLYFHIWELDAEQPEITAAGRMQRLRHYRNLSQMAARLRRYLESYHFTTIADRLALTAAPTRMPKPRAENSAMPEVARESAASTRTPLSVVIPCYNEESSLTYLDKTLAQFAAGSGASYDLRFIFVDDGSQDGTWTILRQLFEQRTNCRLIQHAKNQGVAAAILTGIAHAETELVAVIDADCTFDPHQLADMMELMTEDVDMVIASPLHGEGTVVNVPAWRMVLSRGAAFLYQRVLHHKFSSYTSCFRIYRREAVAGMTVLNGGFCGVAEIFGRLDLAGYRIVEYPAVLEIRVLGQSKINTIRTIFDHLVLIARLAVARWLGWPLPSPQERRSRNG